MGIPTRTSGSVRHSSGGVMSDAGPMSPEIPVNPNRSSSLDQTYGEDLGRLTPNSGQWSRGAASVSLSRLESISLSDIMHPCHDMPFSQRSPVDTSTEALGSSLALWDLLEISQKAYDELWVILVIP